MAKIQVDPFEAQLLRDPLKGSVPADLRLVSYRSGGISGHPSDSQNHLPPDNVTPTPRKRPSKWRALPKSARAGRLRSPIRPGIPPTLSALRMLSNAKITGGRSFVPGPPNFSLKLSSEPLFGKCVNFSKTVFSPGLKLRLGFYVSKRPKTCKKVGTQNLPGHFL